MLAGGAYGKVDDGMWDACSTVLMLSIRMGPESVEFVDTIHDTHAIHFVLSTVRAFDKKPSRSNGSKGV